MQQTQITDAERLRLQKAKFERDTFPKRGFVQDKPHPLYNFLKNKSDMKNIAVLCGVSENYVCMLLRGVRCWIPQQGVSGDKKRKIIWAAQKYVWNRIQEGLIDRYPTPRPEKGERRNSSKTP
jgi:glutathione peroxidase-family protein